MQIKIFFVPFNRKPLEKVINRTKPFELCGPKETNKETEKIWSRKPQMTSFLH